jgi:hypothetical protein
MIEDEIVRGVRATREAFAAAHGYDIRAMVAALHEYGMASGRRVVRLDPRRPTTTGGKATGGSNPEPTDSVAPSCSQPPLTEVGR